MTTSNEHNNAPDVPQGWKLVQTPITEEMHVAAVKVLLRATGLAGLPQRVLDAMLAATPAPAPAPAQGEPFGHFRAEPFGWTDCAKDDEGAIALYERPQEVGLTDEEIFEVAEPFGAFQYGDAQGDKRLDFARAIIAALRAKGANDA